MSPSFPTLQLCCLIVYILNIFVENAMNEFTSLIWQLFSFKSSKMFTTILSSFP
uniref:Uncharacterized protein n=1 Tax=Lepeophtheirus salmonis TaxID=72036 RepID=A0A0K2V7K0_LEPSM